MDTCGQRLVVVDGVPETAQVLRAVFEPRGHRVDRVRAYESAPPPGDDEPGEGVFVLHRDETHARDEPAPVENQRGHVRRVIIGSLAAEQREGDQQLAQPFQYAELIQAVERLLTDPPEAEI